MRNRQRVVLPKQALQLLAEVVRSNGAGHPAKGYWREYLIGAALAKPRGDLLVHTRLGLETYRVATPTARRRLRPVGSASYLPLGTILRLLTYG